VVEDEAMIAALIEAVLAEAGCLVVGPVASLERALQSVESGRCDAAVLDVRVNNAEAYCVADALLDRRIPFVFVSGFAQKDMPAKYRACPYLAKPFEPAAILERLREAVARGEATPLAGPI
jgi:CheY-like chemotaxis protein